jgi:hypothetical protein
MDRGYSPPLALAVERKASAFLVLAHHLPLGVLRGLLSALEGVVPPHLRVAILRGDVLGLLAGMLMQWAHGAGGGRPPVVCRRQEGRARIGHADRGGNGVGVERLGALVAWGLDG